MHNLLHSLSSSSLLPALFAAGLSAFQPGCLGLLLTLRRTTHVRRSFALGAFELHNRLVVQIISSSTHAAVQHNPCESGMQHNAVRTLTRLSARLLRVICSARLENIVEFGSRERIARHVWSLLPVRGVDSKLHVHLALLRNTTEWQQWKKAWRVYVCETLSAHLDHGYFGWIPRH
jgi:hypothetical protein